MAQTSGLSQSLQFSCFPTGHSGYLFDISTSPYPSKKHQLQDLSPTRKSYDFLPFFFLSFSLSLRYLEHLKVTTLLASKMRSFPVAGFIPRRFFFSFTQNLPKPEIRRPRLTPGFVLLFLRGIQQWLWIRLLRNWRFCKGDRSAWLW